MAIAYGLNPAWQQLAQRRQCLLGPVGLPEREQAVDDDDADDGNAEFPHAATRIEMLGDEGQRSRQPEQQREEVRELPGQSQPWRLADHRLDAVGPELGQPTRRLLRGQPR
ncbi:MAG: hypothetical protein IPG52_09245 [Rhodocyclaceae bacterium]|nr:hypothetical protein [Rhodocyclaceae bacterium]